MNIFRHYIQYPLLSIGGAATAFRYKGHGITFITKPQLPSACPPPADKNMPPFNRLR